MARRPEPRWYASRGGWYAWIKGKQIRLAVGKDAKEEAWKHYHRLMLEAEPEKRREHVSASVLFDLLLDWIKTHRKALTYEFYVAHLSSAARAFGALPAHEVRPADVNRWLDRQTWSRSTRHGAITAVKRAFRWGVRQGLLDSDPLAAMERPGIARRREALSPAQAHRLLAEVDPFFGDLLTVLYETGMRPSEAYRLEAAHIDWSRSQVIYHEHKTEREGRPRVIYLSPTALAILRRLAFKHPTGPLLRNSRGNPWSRHAVAQKFGRLRRRLGMGREATADALRHLFVTDCLDRGIPIATVAQLVGHTSTSMIEKTYSHLHERTRHLQEAVNRVRSSGASAGPAPPEPRRDPAGEPPAASRGTA